MHEYASEIEFHPWTSEPQVASLITALIDIHECTNVLEVGVFKGATALAMLWDGVNYTGIDIEDHRHDIVKQEMKGHKFILGNSLDVLKTLPKQHFDLIFIDSLHEYDHIMQEFKLCERIIKKGGLILFHDSIGIEDVKRIINYIKGFKHFEVVTLRTPYIEGRGFGSGVSIVKCNYE